MAIDVHIKFSQHLDGDLDLHRALKERARLMGWSMSATMKHYATLGLNKAAADRAAQEALNKQRAAEQADEQPSSEGAPA